MRSMRKATVNTIYTTLAILVHLVLTELSLVFLRVIEHFDVAMGEAT
jgi:hypothetical protein